MNYIRNQDILNNHMVIANAKNSFKLEFDIEDRKFSIINLPNKEDFLKLTKKYNNVIFVNTVEDHILYIEEMPFVLRNEKELNKVAANLSYMSRNNIELNELKLRLEAENEANENGYIQVLINKKENHIKNCHVKTAAQFFANQEYNRIILPYYSIGVDNTFFDDVFDLVSKKMNKHIVFIVNDDISGAMMIKSILKIYITTAKNEIISKNNKADKDNYIKTYRSELINKHNIQDCQIPFIDIALEGKYKVIMNLLHILDNNKAKKILDSMFDAHCDIRLLLVDEIAENKQDYGYINLLLSRYIMLIVLTDYILSKKTNNNDDGFIDYIAKHYEYDNLCRFLKTKQTCETLISPLHKLFTYNKENKLMLETAILVKIAHKNAENKKYHTKKENTEYTTHNTEQKIISTPIAKYLHIATNISIKNEQNVILINLREEPHIFISNQLFILRDYEQYNKNITYLRFVSKSKIEEIENNIKKRIILELANEKHIKYYKYENGVLIESCMANITESDIHTTKEYFSKFYSAVHYIRRPVTSSVPFSFDMFDKIKQMITKHRLLTIKKDIHLFSQTSSGRAAYIAIIFEILANTSNEIQNFPLPPYQVFLLLTKLLPEGNKAHAFVAHLFYKYFRSDLVQYINKESILKNVIRSLKKYFLLVCFASYTFACKQDVNTAKDSKTNIEDVTDTSEIHKMLHKNISFKKWMIEQKAVLHQYNELSKINLDHIRVKEDIYDENIQQRNGKVLKSMMILKNDNFIGSKIFTEYSKVNGVRNLRIIKLKQAMIIGLSMPTENGIDNVIKMLPGKGAVLWFCLREEPIAYINGFPYCLRNYNTPNSNIEITGVTTERVEQIENDLKVDIAQNNKIYLHDEIRIQQNIKTIAKHVELNKLRTPKEVYSKYKIKYYRIPITDEQIPLPHVIDSIHNKIVSTPNYKTLIFNCQVGRGRTTTGMVIAYLIIEEHNKKYYDIRYKIISYLMQILPHGSVSKQITDNAIDQLEHVINLRTMIQAYENNKDEKSYNFLKRYMYLICFSEFLLQKKEETFVKFLENRKEIQNIFLLVDKIGFELL